MNNRIYAAPTIKGLLSSNKRSVLLQFLKSHCFYFRRFFHRNDATINAYTTSSSLSATKHSSLESGQDGTPLTEQAPPDQPCSPGGLHTPFSCPMSAFRLLWWKLTKSAEFHLLGFRCCYSHVKYIICDVTGGAH